jgi:outer membrane lipoprotein-sorting protein
MNINHTPHDPLDAAEAALRELPSHVVPSTATLNRIATLAMNPAVQLRPAPATPSTAGGWRKVAAVLVTSAALVVVAFGVMHSPNKTFAFEDVVAAVRNADTVSYTTVVTPKNGPSSSFKSIHKGSVTRMVGADGSYTVMDIVGQKMLMVQPATKTATLTQLGKAPKEIPTMRDSIIGWLKSAETTGKAVGEKMVDGVRTVGFEADFGAITFTLWSDPKTKLPVLIESTIGSPSEPIQMTMREFIFNAPVEDGLFSTEVPSGYQVKEIQQPVVDFTALVKLPPEEHVVRILKFYSGLYDGAFPERIDGPELVSKLTSRAGTKRLEDPQFMKEFTELSGSMGATWTFRQTLDKFGYLGGKHLNDADTIVFWYLPKETEKYRVVYADLTVGDVTEEKLPKLPAK